MKTLGLTLILVLSVSLGAKDKKGRNKLMPGPGSHITNVDDGTTSDPAITFSDDEIKIWDGDEIPPQTQTWVLGAELRTAIFQANEAALTAQVAESQGRVEYLAKVVAKFQAIVPLARLEGRATEICRAGGLDFDAKAVKCVEVKTK